MEYPHTPTKSRDIPIHGNWEQIKRKSTECERLMSENAELRKTVDNKRQRRMRCGSRSGV